MKGLRSSVFRGIYLYFWSNWLQAAENLHEFETALGIHFFFFFFLMHCILQRPVFIASANTVKVCKCKSQPPNRNHMAQCKPCAYAGVHLLCWAHHYSSVTCTSKSSCTKNESEIYSTSTTPLKLPVSLLSLGQPPFRATLREYLREQLPRRKSRPSPS